MTRVGFIGLGIMGSRMAAHLGEVTVWNRTRAVAEEFAAAHPGAVVAASPAELAARSDVVVTMVVDAAQVQDVVARAAEGAAPGTLFVDCSTIGPAAARTIGAQLASRGLALLDAPVTGSAPRAADATLTIMAGGDSGDFERARPVLERMGSLVLHVGALGQGQMIKLINNAVAAANAATVAEALLVGSAAGVDLDALVAVMESGSGGSAALTLKERAMREHDYEPLFRLAHMLKDVRLCLEASPVGFSAAERACADLEEAERLGFGEQDFAALLEAAERRSGTRLHEL
jgi:3-hydroxyisobutyrate dehydrogenase-like beta-hydroxyacid dehydrogenase